MAALIPILDRPTHILDITAATRLMIIAMTFRPIVGTICKAVAPVIMSGGIVRNHAICAENKKV